ncbi:MAG TPA: TIGR03885 family FMN-dependent LLM class oxidoreductase [Geminicoccaceae bacterium]|nr:TIGR03885 family FMN-dependent LLM class oxidoreductase [Geminicoccaceae bacterium]
MAEFGFHASHEQFPPSHLLACVRMAEQAGFQAAMCSDHFHPWSERQGQSGFAWSWLGAALQATSLPCGVVCAPGQRYHPAVVAQAAATLAEMFPGRFWLAVGSGEALNERVTGEPWPPKPERDARLRECVDVIRALFAGETVTHRGRVRVERAKLYSRPKTPPPIIGAAVSEATAAWMGGWADGLITISHEHGQLARTVEAFHRGGGEGKPLHLQVGMSFARTEEEALKGAHDQWRTNILRPSLAWNLETPEQFDAVAEFIRPEDVRAKLRVSADPERHVAWLRRDVELGFTGIYLHNVGGNLPYFIETFGERVLPAVTGS